jgi:hypothetical protein
LQVHETFAQAAYFPAARLSVILKNLFQFIPSREISPISNHRPAASNLIVKRICPPR